MCFHRDGAHPPRTGFQKHIRKNSSRTALSAPCKPNTNKSLLPTPLVRCGFILPQTRRRRSAEAPYEGEDLISLPDAKALQKHCPRRPPHPRTPRFALNLHHHPVLRMFFPWRGPLATPRFQLGTLGLGALSRRRADTCVVNEQWQTLVSHVNTAVNFAGPRSKSLT